MPRGPDYQKERSERQQQRIIAALTDGPATAEQIGVKLHLNRKTAQEHLTLLISAPKRRVRVHSYTLTPNRPQAIYALGSEPNITAQQYQESRVLDTLRDVSAPLTAIQIAALINVSHCSARVYVSSLLCRRRIHIADWKWIDKKSAAAYRFGRGEDAVRPTKKPIARPKIAASLWFAALPGAQAIIQQREAA